MSSATLDVERPFLTLLGFSGLKDHILHIPERIVTEEENNIGNSYVKDVGVVRNNAMHPWSPMEILLNGKA